MVARCAKKSILGVFVLLGVVVVSIVVFRSNYLLFHACVGVLACCVLAGLFLVAWNIRHLSRYKKIFRDLTRSNSLLNEIGQMANVGGWHVTLPEGTVVWSQQMYHLLGFPDDHQPTLQSLITPCQPNQRLLLDSALQSCLAEGIAINMEIRLDGPEDHWLRMVAHADRNEAGTIISVSGCLQDVTAIKKQQQERFAIRSHLEQSRRLKSLGVLAGGVAHDFNNLLQVIAGHCEMVRMELDADSPLHGDLANIQHAAREAEDIAAKMLAYSGQGTFLRQSVSLNSILRQIENGLRFAMPKSHHEITLDLATHLPLMQADPDQLNQLVHNLVENATDALGELHGRVTLKTEPVTLDGQPLPGQAEDLPTPTGPCIMLEVSDTGDGIEPEDLPHVCEPFFSTKFVGRGLGLSAVFGIVGSYGGTLTIHSQPHEGTTVRVYLPLNRSEPKVKKPLTIPPRRVGPIKPQRTAAACKTA